MHERKGGREGKREEGKGRTGGKGRKGREGGRRCTK
jgi:hypothetical protein